MSLRLLFKYIRYSIIALYRIYYVCFRMLGGVPRLNNSKSAYQIWSYDFFTPRYFYSDLFINDIGLYAALRRRGYQVSIYTRKDIGRFDNKYIFINVDVKRNPYKFVNYVSFQQHLFKLLEEQGNIVFCTSKEVAFWENKKVLYERFQELGIRFPKTFIYPKEEVKYEQIDYPILLKEVHSSSSEGIHLVRNKACLDQILLDESFRRRNRWIILQKLLNIRRDLRVILVGEEIVWFYWRINPAKEWKPTATSRGSFLDFNNFPERWREWILSQFRKTGLTTGAFDIAWENDDIDTEPYILEVSPYYQPNPPMPFNVNNEKISYSKWKKSLPLRHSYHAEFIKLVFQIKQKYIDFIFSSNSLNQ